MKKLADVPISVLDLVPIREGGAAPQAFRNALDLARQHGFRSIAFPLLGAGSGGFNRERAKVIMLDEFSKSDAPIDVALVSYKAG